MGLPFNVLHKILVHWHASKRDVSEVHFYEICEEIVDKGLKGFALKLAGTYPFEISSKLELNAVNVL